MKKIGRLIQELLDDFLPTLNFKYTIYNGSKFFWKDEDDPSRCELIRKSGEGNNRRDAKDVPIEEAVNAIKYSMKEFGGDDENIVREAAKLMGYTRLGSVVLPLYLEAFKRVLGRNAIL